MEYSILKNKNYVIVSKWAYPYGGGEAFLYTTMEWASKLGMNVYWIAFTDGQNKNFNEFIFEEHKYGNILKIPGGFSEKVLIDWLRLLNPDIVHHQGHLRKLFFNACDTLRIPFMSGFHFWHGAIILDSVKKNIDIIENCKSHKTDPELEYMLTQKGATLYTVTPFVAQCIDAVTGHSITDYIYSSSSYEATRIPEMDITCNKFVTLINIHYLKGGELFLYLIENCRNISFMGVKTEHMSEDLDEKIKAAMEKRNNENNGTQCLLLDRVENTKVIYQQTKILLAPSMVDETFCRVVNEAMMNGIPVISTGQGNIKYLMQNSGYLIPYNDKEQYVNTLQHLYTNDTLLKEQSEKTLKDYENFSEEKASMLFRDLTKKVLLNSKIMNVMIFTPWCDQGLGIQSRTYAKLLQKQGYNVAIFAIKPYNANSCIELQKDPTEWAIDNIYYSPNDREHVDDYEIIDFVKNYNIGKCLLPETCWFRVFEIAKLFNKINVKCYAIPNIEIVRKDEIFKHRYFHKILCNNHLCEKIFNDFGITNTEYIGYALYDPKNNIRLKKKKKEDKINFVFIGGMNAFSRKHILSTCEAFSKVWNIHKNINLTCTVQKTNLLEAEDKDKLNEYLEHPAFTFIQSHLSYTDIIDLYYNSHISIQVSKHEGLGIGFYESLATGTPVITLDTQPHNEIIINDVNGWTIPCFYKTMADNKDPLFESAYFDPNVLAKKICEIIDNFDKSYFPLTDKLMIDYVDRLHINNFKPVFFNSIN